MIGLHMLFSWLHKFSDLTILAVVVFVVTGLTMAAPYFGRFVLRLKPNAERSTAAFDAFKAIISMVGVVLAFSLVQANGNLRDVQTTVAKEATTLMTTDRILLRIGKPEFAAMRPLLDAYGSALVVSEWPCLATGCRSADADEAFTQLSKKIRSIGPDDARQQSMYSELLKAIDDLADLREQILADTDLSLPEFFWVTNFGLLIIAFGLGALTECTLAQTVGLGSAATAIALLLAFVIIVDRPFEGETSVKSSSIEKALVINSHRL